MEQKNKRAAARCLDHEGFVFCLVRADLMAICGHFAASVLLSLIEQWTDRAVKAGKEPPWIYRSQKQFVADSCGALSSEKVVKGATDVLLRLGFIEKQRNPKLAFDRKWQYLLLTERVQHAIDALDRPELRHGGCHNVSADLPGEEGAASPRAHSIRGGGDNEPARQWRRMLTSDTSNTEDKKEDKRDDLSEDKGDHIERRRIGPPEDRFAALKARVNDREGRERE